MNIIVEMMPGALMVATPIVIAALGGLFSERSGVTNIALEGIMAVGAFASATAVYFLEKNNFLLTSGLSGWVSLLFGIIAGTLFSILLAVAAINYRADQTISGTALNMMALGVTVFLCQIIFNQQRTESFMRGISRVKEVPILSNIPIIGDMFFKNIYPTAYVGFILVAVTYFIVFKTPFGLRLRSCGENPQASASVGINVFKMRYIGVLTSGALGGLAGGIMVLTSGTQFTIGSIHGVGFIALAALIFGKWKPLGVLGASIFFGFSQTIGIYAGRIPLLALLPSEFFSAIPYVFTIIALIVFSSKAVGPKAAGEIYDSGKR